MICKFSQHGSVKIGLILNVVNNVQQTKTNKRRYHNDMDCVFNYNWIDIN